MGGECEICVECGRSIWGNEDDLFVCGECGWETDAEECLDGHVQRLGGEHDEMVVERQFDFPEGEYEGLEEL